MRWLLIILGVLVVLTVAVVIVGMVLPVKHTATRSVSVPRPPAAVWAVITEHAKDPEWRGDVSAVVRVADRNEKAVWEEQYKTGDRMKIEDTEAIPNQKLVRTIVDQTIFSGIWTYQLTPSADGSATTVTITEDGEIYNPVFRAVSKFVIGRETTLKKYLGYLEKRLGV